MITTMVGICKDNQNRNRMVVMNNMLFSLQVGFSPCFLTYPNRHIVRLSFRPRRIANKVNDDWTVMVL